MNKLINKSYRSYDYTSRYSAFPYYYNTTDNKYMYGLTAYLNDETTYTLYTVKQGDTIDRIAMREYNNPTLFWVICSFNRIRNPYTELVPGTTLKLPSISTLEYDKEGRS